jgi:diguanylate cyclase (GGDEF)-like protein
MAASESTPRSEPLQAGWSEPLSASALSERLDEEIRRAERHGTKLSCLLLTIDNVEELVREHGSELPDQTLVYVAAALRRELRRFDRIGRPSEGELLIVLPGADGPLGEMVARRVLDRMRAIKVEAEGTRRPLQISMGLAAWRVDMTPADLLARAREATRARNGNGNGDPPPPLEPAAADDEDPGASANPPGTPPGGGTTAFERPAPS